MSFAEKYPFFEKTGVPRYGWLHAGKGEFLDALHAWCRYKWLEVRRVSEVTRQMMALGEAHRKSITNAVKLVEAFYTKFKRFHENARYQGIDGLLLSLDMLGQSTTSAGALKEFLASAQAFPHKLIFQPNVQHHLFGCAPSTSGHYNLSLTMPELKHAYSRNAVMAFGENSIDANALSGNNNHAIVTHGGLVKTVNDTVKTRKKKTVRATGLLGLLGRKREIEVEEQDAIKREEPVVSEGQRMFAIRLHFPDQRYDERGRSHTAYTVILPENEYKTLLPQVRKNPHLMAELYNAVYPWHSRGKTFTNITVAENVEQWRKATLEIEKSRRGKKTKI